MIPDKAEFTFANSSDFSVNQALFISIKLCKSFKSVTANKSLCLYKLKDNSCQLKTEAMRLLEDWFNEKRKKL